MVMGWIWTLLVGCAIVCAVLTGQTAQIAAAALKGAQSGVEATVAIAGSLSLWCGVGALMEQGRLTAGLARILSPLLRFLFPSTQYDPILAGDLSGNICANILGLGNAATPMGIRATKRMLGSGRVVTDEMCRLIVLNTASIQLIPGNVAAVRAGLGAVAPFDILPAVWITSILSAGAGLTAAWIMGKLWSND